MTLRTFSLNPLRVGLISGLAVAGLLLSGCAGGEPQGSGTPSPSVSDSPGTTTTPTPTPSAAYKPASATGKAENVPVPVLPEEAKKETKEGAIAFTKYWFQLMGYAYETGDVAPLAAATGPACDMCNSVMRVVPKAYSEDSWLVGGTFSTPSVDSNFNPQADQTIPVTVQVIQTRISYHDATGAEYRSATEQTSTGNVAFLKYFNGSWKLHGVNPIQ